MSREHWGWVVWYGWWLALNFCVLEALAVWWSACPWPTFSTTTMSLQARWDFLTVPIFCILAILVVHLPRFANLKAGELKKNFKKARIDYNTKRVEIHRDKLNKHKNKVIQLNAA
jgi:type VI protein secretion system component VasK